MKKAKPMPTTKPMIMPNAILSGLFGRTGRSPGLAVSTISTMVVLGSSTSIFSLAIFMSKI